MLNIMSLSFAIFQLTIFDVKNFNLFKTVLRFTWVVGLNLRYTSLLHQLNEAILWNFAMNSVEVYRSFQNFLFPESLPMFAELFSSGLLLRLLTYNFIFLQRAS